MAQQTLGSMSQLPALFAELERTFLDLTYQPPLAATEQLLAREHAERWPRATAPNGRPWKPLRPSTIRRKGHSRILVDTSRLQESVVNPSHPDHVREVLDRGLTFGTSVPYGIFHQDGTQRLPQREFLGMNETTLTQTTDLIADHAVDGLAGRV